MPQIFGLLDRRYGIQDGEVQAILSVRIWIDIDVSDIEGCEILEEMSPLAGVDLEVRKLTFDDRLGFGNIAPTDRNAQ